MVWCAGSPLSMVPYASDKVVGERVTIREPERCACLSAWYGRQGAVWTKASEMRRGQTGIAPAVLSEKDSGGCGHALLEKTDVCESIGKGTRFSGGGWNVHRGPPCSLSTQWADEPALWQMKNGRWQS